MTGGREARAYLDHNATSPLRPKVRDAMIDAMQVGGNPSSVHAEGRRARAIVETARENIVALLGADAGELMFTSGGTEANNTVLSPRLIAKTPQQRARALCFVSAVEHPSVLAGGRFDKEQVRIIPATSSGVVDIEAFMALLEENNIGIVGSAAASRNPPFMVSVMLANNETGVVQPVTEISAITLERGGFMHCDAVQALGRMPFDLSSLGVDLLTIAAHKIGGPKGIGALVGPGVDRILQDPLIKGGGQELGRRAGTENVMAAAGFGAVVELACEELADREMVGFLRDRLETRLGERFGDLVVFAKDAHRLDNTSMMALPGVSSQRVLMNMDLDGVAISAGSACSSGKIKGSPVLAAMGVAPELAECAFRVSFGPENWLPDIDRLTSVLEKVAARGDKQG